MAGAKDVILGQLQLGQTVLGNLTADLADEEYFKPVLDGLNHVGWILGHIAYAEAWAVSLITGTANRLPDTMRELFDGGSTCRAGSAGYPTRAEIDDLFQSTRAATVEALTAFEEGRWDDPSPEQAPREFFPTLGSLWGMLGTHQFWHIGQATQCRTAMGKKGILQG
jgi:hypothetical protein